MIISAVTPMVMMIAQCSVAHVPPKAVSSQVAAKNKYLARNSRYGMTASLHRWPGAPASDCETRSTMVVSQPKESEMCHAGVQNDLTGGRSGVAVSFATKEEAIAYIVSHAPHGISLFDIAAVESGLTVEETGLLAPLADTCRR
jgi:hypothetical protein